MFSIVGMTRLELATSRPPDACANQLRYIPYFLKASAKIATYSELTKQKRNFLQKNLRFSLISCLDACFYRPLCAFTLIIYKGHDKKEDMTQKRRERIKQV